MIIKGYKAFNKDRTNRYKVPYIEGEIYRVEGPLSFGNNGNGIHFCKNLEDTLRYFPALTEEISIASVTSLEDVVEYYDDYYGYYDMYAARCIKIDKFLEREEIIKMYLNADERKVLRFIMSFKLTEDEKQLFKIAYNDNISIMRAIMYYQEKNIDTYTKVYEPSKIKVKNRGGN
jgi:hypothetical protein